MINFCIFPLNSQLNVLTLVNAERLAAFNLCLAKLLQNQIKIKSSLYSPYYAEACNEWRGPSPQLSAWATQLRRNVATVASYWRYCADLTGPGIKPQASRTDSVRLATELTGRSKLLRAILISVSQQYFPAPNITILG